MLVPAQVAVTVAALAAAAHGTGLPWPAPTVIGAGIALSSTAIILPMLAERDLLGTPSGRDTFAVLLFHGLAFIPLVAVAFGLGCLGGQSNRAALRFALPLPQGSEFSFVLFSAAVTAGAPTQAAFDRVTLAIALSMAATPLVFTASERFVVPRLQVPAKPAYDAIQDDGAAVIICGLRPGRPDRRAGAAHAQHRLHGAGLPAPATGAMPTC